MFITCKNCSVSLKVAVVPKNAKCPKCGSALLPNPAARSALPVAQKVARLIPEQPCKLTTAAANKRRVKLAAIIATLVILVPLFTIRALREPLGRLPLTSYRHFDYSARQGYYATRTTVNAQGDILRVERVHLCELPNGGNGDVDGILKQVVYGKPWWGGQSRPLITYDAEKQTVTKHSLRGDTTYTAKEFGSVTGFEISAYNHGQVAGFYEPCTPGESSNVLVMFTRRLSRAYWMIRNAPHSATIAVTLALGLVIAGALARHHRKRRGGRPTTPPTVP